MKKIDITKKKIIFLILPLLLVVAGVVAYFVNGGFNFDIEFMGGVRMQVDMEKKASNEEVSSFLEEKLGISPVIVQSGEGNSVVIKTQPITEEQEASIYPMLKEKYQLTGETEMSKNKVDPTFGANVQGKAVFYTLIAILLILAYIAFRFEWRSAIMAVLSLALNILVMMAVYAITFTPLNTTFIAAMLTVIGYSINNTIVVFDRIRENMKGYRAGKNAKPVAEIVNASIWASMGRTINTTITTLITIVLLYVLGVPAIKEFAFPLIVGVIAGVYSSIFIASPFWASWKQASYDKKQK
ncbi:MAG: protein translocase subunit SecF [Clostridia bacterium]|nr:protein translocase subunit SecF [Clostridia bacterium]